MSIEELVIKGTISENLDYSNVQENFVKYAGGKLNSEWPKKFREGSHVTYTCKDSFALENTIKSFCNSAASIFKANEKESPISEKTSSTQNSYTLEIFLTNDRKFQIEAFQDKDVPDTWMVDISGLFDCGNLSNDDTIKIQKQRVNEIKESYNSEMRKLRSKDSPEIPLTFVGLPMEVKRVHHKEVDELIIKFSGFGYRGDSLNYGPVDYNSQVPLVELANKQIDLVRGEFSALALRYQNSKIPSVEIPKSSGVKSNTAQAESEEIYVNYEGGLSSRLWNDMSGGKENWVGNDPNKVYILGLDQLQKNEIIKKIQNGKEGGEYTITILVGNGEPERYILNEHLPSVQRSLHAFNKSYKPKSRFSKEQLIF